MPVIRHTHGRPDASKHDRLVRALAEELRNPAAFGQPVVNEETFSRTGLVGVTVMWDEWAGVADADRTTVVLKAYETAAPAVAADKVAFALGVTTAEAVESGLLPFEVVAMLRPGDPVTPDQCKEAMVELGATRLIDPSEPRLLLPTLDSAKAYKTELARRLPGSEPVWGIRTQFAIPPLPPLGD